LPEGNIQVSIGLSSVGYTEVEILFFDLNSVVAMLGPTSDPTNSTSRSSLYSLSLMLEYISDSSPEFTISVVSTRGATLLSLEYFPFFTSTPTLKVSLYTNK
jgi:hypothetical protein